VKNGLKSSQFLADLTNSAWRILADFYIRSGGLEKKSSGNAGAGKQAPYTTAAKDKSIRSSDKYNKYAAHQEGHHCLCNTACVRHGLDQDSDPRKEAH
jgi:hypothetical protein